MKDFNSIQQELLALKNSGFGPLEAIQKLRSGDGTNVQAQVAGATLGFEDTDSLISSQVLVNAITAIWQALTPLQLAQFLKAYNDDPLYVATGLMSEGGYPDLTAIELGKLLLDPTMFPNLPKEDMYTVLTGVKFTPEITQSAIAVLYKIATSYALNLSNNPSYLTASGINAYNFGTSDFSLQAWVKTTGSGTIISRKSTDGGSGNGGFLLVIKNGGSIKFATDNGYGFFEINSIPTLISDGNWHFLTAVRHSNVLQLYLDGNMIQSSPRSNINPPINVNNSLPMMIGNVAQVQEQFRQFNGALDEIRIWNRSLSGEEIIAAMKKPLNGNEQGLVGYYTFSSQNGDDSSPSKNNATATGSVSFISPGAI